MWQHPWQHQMLCLLNLEKPMAMDLPGVFIIIIFKLIPGFSQAPKMAKKETKKKKRAVGNSAEDKKKTKSSR